MRIWLLWFYRRWRGLGAAAIAVLALLLVALLLWGRPALSVRLLGNTNAPRLAAQGSSGVILPRSSNADAGPGMLADPMLSMLDAPVHADVGPQTVAAAQAAWSTDEITRHQDALLAAINCARQAKRLNAVTLDARLSETAGVAWLRLVREPSFSLMQLPGQYAMRSILALNADSYAMDGAQAQMTPSDSNAPLCDAEGFDTTRLPVASGATQIGIAVFPPQASWDMPSAVILMQ